jgi:dynactin complex subunit
MTHAMVVMKIVDIDRNTLVSILSPLTTEIVDIRET